MKNIIFNQKNLAIEKITLPIIIITILFIIFLFFVNKSIAQTVNSYTRTPSGTTINTGTVNINYTMTFSDVVGGYSVYLITGEDEIEIGRTENCYENTEDALTVSGTSNFTLPNGTYEVILVGYYDVFCVSFQEQVLLPSLDTFTVSSSGGGGSPASLNVNIFENKKPPINLGSVTQRKSGALVVHGLRSTAPARLDGLLKIPTGAGAGKILTSDGAGFASWGDAPVGGGSDPWTSDVPLTTVKLTNIGDKVGIGINTPNNLLQVSGLINFNDASTNTGIGFQTLNNFVSGTNNTALGYQALFGGANASGSSNTAIGKDALKVNTSGSFNTAVGALALDSNTIGSRNTALGYQALHNNVSGSDNTAIGHNTLAGGVNASGSFNTAIGQSAISVYTTGANNTAIGTNALLKLTTGSNNTAIGSGALAGLTTGSNNTAIGFNAGATSNNSGPAGITNATAITFGINDSIASGIASNTMVFYSQSGAQLWIPSFGFGTQSGGYAIRVGTNTNNGNAARLTVTGLWQNTSDRTKKHDIQNISVGLKEVLQLRPVDFKWNGSNTQDLGFIAQEVKPILPLLVSGEEGDMAISYSQMSAVLTRAVQEQQEIIEDYKEKIKTYTERIEKLEQQKINKINHE